MRVSEIRVNQIRVNQGLGVPLLHPVGKFKFLNLSKFALFQFETP